jgi:hypothetical protein
MDAQEFMLPLLFDPLSIKVNHWVGMLFYERMGICDDILMEQPIRLREYRKASRINQDANNGSRRVCFTHVGIVTTRNISRLVDMRDAFCANNDTPQLHEHLVQQPFPPLPPREGTPPF